MTYAYTPDKLSRSSMTDINPFGEVTNYSSNALNQYASTAGNSYSYDSNFNLTHVAGFSGVYDAANHLVSAAGGSSGESQQTVAGFVYDGLGRCVKRTLNGVATVFAFDGWKPIMEWDDNGDLQAWNVYGPGADEILLRHQGPYGYIRFHLDRHGNVAFLLDNDGREIEKYTYDAFGRPTVTDWDGGRPRSWSFYGHCFLFQGREYIRELSIYDYRNRFYYPALGRFLQSDPMGFSAGDMNLFRYVNDDPIDGSDPTGLIGDFMWDFAKYSDPTNTSQGSFKEYTNRSYMGDNGGGGPGSGSGHGNSISPTNEGQKGSTPPLRTPQENFKIADDWLKKHYKELGVPDPRDNKAKLVRIPGPAAGDWNPFRGIRLDPYKNKSPASFVDSYSEELLHAKAGFIHYVRDVFQGDQSPHHQQIRQRSSDITSQFDRETGTRYAEPYTDDH